MLPNLESLSVNFIDHNSLHSPDRVHLSITAAGVLLFPARVQQHRLKEEEVGNVAHDTHVEVHHQSDCAAFAPYGCCARKNDGIYLLLSPTSQISQYSFCGICLPSFMFKLNAF